MFRRILSLVFFACFVGCGSVKSYRVGVDPSWFPLDTANKEANLFAFTNELLKEVAARKKIKLQRVSMSWDNLLDSLKNGTCDAVLTTMKPTILNQKHYRFSQSILQTGPVLVVPIESKFVSLDKMDGQILLISKGSWILDYMASYPEVELQFYTYIPDAMEDLVKARAAGTLIPVIPAFSYVGDLYSNQLKIASEPLLDEGIRLALMQSGDEKLMGLFNDAVEQMKHDGTLERLAKKWSLPY